MTAQDMPPVIARVLAPQSSLVVRVTGHLLFQGRAEASAEHVTRGATRSGQGAAAATSAMAAIKESWKQKLDEVSAARHPN